MSIFKDYFRKKRFKRRQDTIAKLVVGLYDAKDSEDINRKNEIYFQTIILGIKALLEEEPN